MMSRQSHVRETRAMAGKRVGAQLADTALAAERRVRGPPPRQQLEIFDEYSQ
jgi:hypothetical protein